MSDTARSRPRRSTTHLAQLDLNLLVMLRELLRERNVTRAGERLGVTQPAASAALLRLRRYFDDELLVRGTGGYTLSPLAAELAGQVEQACAAVERIFATASSFDPGTSNREFTLLMSDYTVAVMGEKLSDHIARLAPNVRLNIRVVREPLTNAGELIGGIDGIIVPPLPQLLVPQVHSVELFKDRWVCVCWTGNTVLAERSPKLGELAEMDWVAPHLPDHGGQSSAPILVELAMLGIQPRVSVRVASYQAVATFITGTNRVALMQERLVDKLAARRELRLIDLPELSQTIVEALWWHNDLYPDPAHRWLRQTLTAIGAEV